MIKSLAQLYDIRQWMLQLKGPHTEYTSVGIDEDQTGNWELIDEAGFKHAPGVKWGKIWLKATWIGESQQKQSKTVAKIWALIREIMNGDLELLSIFLIQC